MPPSTTYYTTWSSLAMRTRQEVGTLAVHWRLFIFWTAEPSLSQIPLIEHRRSSKRLSDLTRKACVRSLVFWIFRVSLPVYFFFWFSTTSPTSHQSPCSTSACHTDRRSIWDILWSCLSAQDYLFMGFRPSQIPISYHQWTLVERFLGLMTVVGPKLVIAQAFQQWSSAHRLEKLDRMRQRGGKMRMNNTHCLRWWVSRYNLVLTSADKVTTLPKASFH